MNLDDANQSKPFKDKVRTYVALKLIFCELVVGVCPEVLLSASVEQTDKSVADWTHYESQCCR